MSLVAVYTVVSHYITGRINAGLLWLLYCHNACEHEYTHTVHHVHKDKHTLSLNRVICVIIKLHRTDRNEFC